MSSARTSFNHFELFFFLPASAVSNIYLGIISFFGTHRKLLVCGSKFVNGGGPADPTDCDMTCAGNGTEFCGGPNRLNVYNFTGTGLPTRSGGGGGGDPATVFPVLSGLPTGWAYNACWM